MKKITFVTIIILSILLTLVPASTAFAGKGVVSNDITFINRTHGTIDIRIVDSKGNHFSDSFADSGTNMHTYSITEGIYSYYIRTKCGVEVGTVNLTRNRLIVAYCPVEGLDFRWLIPHYYFK